MDNIEIEQLKNNLAVKVGILEMKINNGSVDESLINLVKLYDEYEMEGSTIEEIKLLFDDVMLALS